MAGRYPIAASRRARRRLQRAHVTALRMTGVGPDLFEVLAAVGAVDILPAATIPTGRSGTQPDTRPDSLGAQMPAVLALSDTLSDTSVVLTRGAAPGPLHPDHRKGVQLTVRSNGLIESTNTKIRLITRIAFGFKSPEALIANALLSLGGHRPTPPGRN